MTNKIWIIGTLCLLLPGGLGLGVYGILESSFREEVASAQKADSEDSAVKDYLNMYEQWLALDPDEKVDTPWGSGNFGGPAVKERLQKGQQNRILLDFADLAKGVGHYPDPLAEVIYGPGWQDSVQTCARMRNRTETLLIASIFLTAAGGLFLLGGLMKAAVVRLINKTKKADSDELSDTVAFSSEEIAEAADPQIQASLENTPQEASSPEKDPDTPDRTPVPASSTTGYFQSRKSRDHARPSKKEPLSLPSLASSPESFSAGGLLQENTNDSYFGWAVDAESAGLEKLMTNEPLSRGLSVLTEEVSAIREFAAQQQDQVRKLQDGYDWMIIRRFCLRIIRCVDNIEDQITRLRDADDPSAEYLADVKDELVFALESSGVEQYEPDLNSPFKGLEKYVEAVRDRIACGEETLSGTIAEILRPGYQYLVNDDEVKIIRCAQVKLFEFSKPI